MTNTRQDSNCVVGGLIEEQAYSSLFRQLLKPEPSPMPTSLKELQQELNKLLDQLKNDENQTEDIKKQIQLIETLNAQYNIYLANKKKNEHQFIPIFAGDEIESIDVIIPGLPKLQTTIEDNPFTQRSAAPVAGSSIALHDPITFMGFDKPANAIYKVNLNNNCSMVFSPENKLTVECRRNDGTMSEEEIKAFQKHVLANAYRNPEAPVNLKFPKTMDDKLKFKIINEMIVAYMSVTGTKGLVDTKGAENRRDQFIKNLIDGGTIVMSDTISTQKGKSPNIFVGSIEGSFLKPAIEGARSIRKDVNQHSFINKPETQNVVKDYQESLRLMNRQEMMMSMLKGDLSEAQLKKFVADEPNSYLLGAREGARSVTNATVSGMTTMQRGLKTFATLGGFTRPNNEGMSEVYGREGIETSYKQMMQGCIAEVILELAKNRGLIDTTQPIDLNNAAFQDIKSTKAYKRLIDNFGMKDGEMQTFINSPEVKKAISNIQNPPAPTNRVGPTS